MKKDFFKFIRRGKVYLVFCFCLSLLSFQKNPVFADSTVAVIYLQGNNTYEFAGADMKQALESAGYLVTLYDIGNLANVIAQNRIIITTRNTAEANNFLSQPGVSPLPSASPEGYSIRKKADAANTDWYIIGADKNGALYGGQDFSRSVLLNGFGFLSEGDKKPYIANRGIKFNVPLDARTPGYSDNGDAAQKNIAEIWDINFWHQLLDNMARNRFNMLSIWSLAPFPSLTDVPEYPNAGLNDVKQTTIPLSGFKSLNGTNMSNPNVLANLVTLKIITLSDKIKFWQEVMQYAGERGIDCYLFNWNTYIYGTENSGYGFTSAVTDVKTKDYFRKATKALISTYPLLKGLGITAGENLNGTEAEKESFLYGAYGQGINDALTADPNRTFRLIHRAHQANIGAIKSAFSGLNSRCSFEFSFKYSQAHMYSSVAPDYIYKTNFLNNIGSSRFFLTVRDDDWYYLRGGSDPAFARAYLKNIPKTNFSGFYLGNSGYTWGREYVSKDPDSPNQLILDKRWYSFKMWGELSYDPDLPDSIFRHILQTRFPKVNAQNLYTAWAKASQVIPWVNRFHNIGCQLDYQWYPEACFSNTGFHDVNKFISVGPQSGEGLMSISSYATAVLNNTAITGTTPLQVAQNLQDISDQALSLISGMAGTDKELRHTISDITAMAWLGHYYAKKIPGATNKSISDKTTDATKKQQYKNIAITHLRDAAECWRNYASQISYAYIPQWLTRMQQTVDIKAIQSKVDNDILLAGGTINRVAVTGVTVSPATVSMDIDGTQQLIATVSPGNATNKNIRWSSGNNSTVTVNANGLVKGEALGNAAITATSLDGSIIAICEITITNDNCNGQPDEGVLTFYQDSDADGFGNLAVITQACAAPAGYVNDNTDCDDSKISVHPGAIEVCNGIDDDCNGQIDEGVCGQQLVSFTLVNASTGQDIQTLTNGAILNLLTLPGRSLNIRANTSPATVGRVVFALTGTQALNKTETTAPYTLFGNNNGNYNAWIPPVGNYTLKATPFTSSSGGTAGTPLTIIFSVINPGANQLPVANAGPDKSITLPLNSVVLSGSGSDPENGANVTYTWTQESGPNTAVFSNALVATPAVSGLAAGSYVFQLIVKDQQPASSAPDQVTVTVKPALAVQQVVSFTLVNASTEQDIQTLTNAATLNLATLPTRNLNIRANTSPATVGRVVFALSGAQGQNRTESGAPYALFGDNNGNYNIWVPPVGDYTLKATPFTTSSGGTAGSALTTSFRVINAAPLTTSLSLESSNLSVKPATLVWPNPATEIVKIRLDNYSSSAVTMHLIDGNGARIKEWKFSPSLKQNTYRLNVNNLAQGLYLVRIADDKGNTKTEKIVIRR